MASAQPTIAQQQSVLSNTTAGSNSAHQSTSYPPQQQYPSPSLPGYAYPPPASGQGTEPTYRASPTGSNVSLPSLSLPPIRTVDGRQQSQQQQQQQHGAPPTSGPPLPPPITQQYYPGHTLPSPQQMNVTSDPTQHLRYPLPPPPDGRIMSGGRHKKEIKRRTKTGCLTCRKRRIKVGRPVSARSQSEGRMDCDDRLFTIPVRWVGGVEVQIAFYRVPSSFAIG